MREGVEILLVEDDENDIELAERVFEKKGVRKISHTVRDGQECIDFVIGKGVYEGQGIAPALKLILLDLNIPKANGLNVLKRIRRDISAQTLHVVVLTGAVKEKEVLDGYTYGIAGYVLKPLDERRFDELYDRYLVPPKAK